MEKDNGENKLSKPILVCDKERFIVKAPIDHNKRMPEALANIHKSVKSGKFKSVIVCKLYPDVDPLHFGTENFIPTFKQIPLVDHDGNVVHGATVKPRME